MIHGGKVSRCARRGEAGLLFVALLTTFVVGITLGLLLFRADEAHEAEAKTAATQRETSAAKPDATDAPESCGAEEREEAEPQDETLTPDAPDAAPAPRSSQGPATLAYWNEINAIIDREQATRDVVGKLTPDKADLFLNQRARAYSYASKSLRALESRNAHPEAKNLALEIAAWYEQGLKLNEQAKKLSKADHKTRRGPQGLEWQAGEAAHRAECETLNARGETVRQRLNRELNISLPPLR